MDNLLDLIPTLLKIGWVMLSITLTVILSSPAGGAVSRQMSSVFESFADWCRGKFTEGPLERFSEEEKTKAAWGAAILVGILILNYYAMTHEPPPEPMGLYQHNIKTTFPTSSSQWGPLVKFAPWVLSAVALAISVIVHQAFRLVVHLIILWPAHLASKLHEAGWSQPPILIINVVGIIVTLLGLKLV